MIKNENKTKDEREKKSIGRMSTMISSATTTNITLITSKWPLNNVQGKDNLNNKGEQHKIYLQ